MMRHADSCLVYTINEIFLRAAEILDTSRTEHLRRRKRSSEFIFFEVCMAKPRPYGIATAEGSSTAPPVALTAQVYCSQSRMLLFQCRALGLELHQAS